MQKKRRKKCEILSVADVQMNNQFSVDDFIFFSMIIEGIKNNTCLWMLLTAIVGRSPSLSHSADRFLFIIRFEHARQARQQREREEERYNIKNHTHLLEFCQVFYLLSLPLECNRNEFHSSLFSFANHHWDRISTSKSVYIPVRQINHQRSCSE